MSAWTIRIEAETDASAERALRQALKSLPLAEDDSAPYRLEINREDVSDGPFEGDGLVSDGDTITCARCNGSGSVDGYRTCLLCNGGGEMMVTRPAGGE